MPKKAPGGGRVILGVSVAAVAVFVAVVGAYLWIKTPKSGKPSIGGLTEKELAQEPSVRNRKQEALPGPTGVGGGTPAGTQRQAESKTVSDQPKRLDATVPDPWNNVIVALTEKDAPDKAVALILKAARDSNGVVSPRAKPALAQASHSLAAPLIEAVSKMHEPKAKVMVQKVWGSVGQGAVPALIEALRKEDLQPYAAEALGEIGPPARDAVPALFQTLRNVKGGISLTRLRIREAVPQIGGDLVTLGRYLDDRNPDVCGLAITTLGKMGASAEPMVPKLAGKLADENAMIGRRAAEALGEIGPAAEPAVPALLRALKNRRAVGVGITVKFGDEPEEQLTFSVAPKAADALGKIGSSDRSVLSALEEAIQKGDKNLASAAQTALKKIRAKSQPKSAPVSPSSQSGASTAETGRTVGRDSPVSVLKVEQTRAGQPYSDVAAGVDGMIDVEAFPPPDKKITPKGETETFVIVAVKLAVPSRQAWERAVLSAYLRGPKNEKFPLIAWFEKGAFRPKGIAAFGVEGLSRDTKLLFSVPKSVSGNLVLISENKAIFDVGEKLGNAANARDSRD